MSLQTTTLAWPPPFKIRKHRLAKYVKLRVRQSHEVEITVPYRFSLKDIPAILEEHKIWIIKQLHKAQAEQITTFPERIALHAKNEVWSVQYMQSDSKLMLIERPGQEIVLVGDVKNLDACKAKIIAWTKVQAKKFLAEQLKFVSEQTGLRYESLSVRDQQTVWGSCTFKKTINLNYKLIFLPLSLMQHILIHELCHTMHLNHSAKFWNLVARFDSAWQEHKRAMRSADKYVPTWTK